MKQIETITVHLLPQLHYKLGMKTITINIEEYGNKGKFKGYVVELDGAEYVADTKPEVIELIVNRLTSI